MHAYWGRGFEILDNHHIHSFLHLPFKQEAVLYGNLDPGLGIRYLRTKMSEGLR